MPPPYHVRLAVSQYGDQFRAELFTEDLGDTEGDVLATLPPSVGEWVPYLAQGAELPPDAARQLGKDLFAALLGQPENAKKWTEVLDRAKKAGQSVRLLIDATTDSVRDLPYGLLCEPHDDWFLFRGGKGNPVRFVRILRRCSPRPLALGDRPRVLVVASEPASPDVPPFDAAGRLKALCVALAPTAEVFLAGADGVVALAGLAGATTNFAPFARATRAGAKAALAGNYDVVHLLAHGHGAGVLLCNADGSPAETTAGELAEWFAAGAAGLAFLQVCKAGQTGGRGGFGGVAQQLLSPRGGNLAAVVASTFPLDAEHSTAAAAGFYKALAAGKSPEEALTADVPEADWTWAFLELWARPGALGGTQQRAAFQFVSPYRGLSSFTERDADLFFGRRAEVTELLNILRSEPAVGVVGDSGSGKTSLLQAGLVYAVRQNGLAGLDRWRIASLRPGYQPGQALLAALKPGDPGPATPAALAAALRADDRPLLVIFDQFEEVFTLARDPADARAMTQALADVVAERPDRVRLVIGMRSEFLGQSAGLPGLSRLLRRPWVLRPPAANNLRDIVAGPAEHCGYTFQGPLADGNPAHAAGLLDRILADPLLAAGDGAVPSLPLLQFALERLWLKAVEAGSTEFTHATYDALGGLGSAIAQHAEATYQATPTATGLGAGARAVAEHVITALVSSRGTRQPRPRAALEAEAGPADATRAVIDYLVGERLLVVRSDPADPAASLVDLAHEALILHWDRLRGWLAEDPQGRAMREEFRTACEKWEAGFAGVPPKSTRGLPGSDVCRNYLTWIDAHSPQLPPVAAEFVAAMRAYLRRIARARQRTLAMLFALTTASCGLAVLAGNKAEQARDNEKQAKKNELAATENAAVATENARLAKVQAAALALDRGVQLAEQGQPRYGLLNMATALKTCPPADSGPDAAALRRVILTNLAGWGVKQFCLDHVRKFPGAAIATDPAGKVILCRTPDGGGQLYDLDPAKADPAPVGKSLKPLLYTDASTQVWADVQADPKTGHWLVLLSHGRMQARLWDATDGVPLGDEFWTRAVGPVVLGPAGARAASADRNGDVHLWNPRAVKDAAGKAVGPPQRHQGKVYALAFSPDGKWLATGCGRGSGSDSGVPGVFHLFDAATGEVKRRAPLGVPVTAVGFSPDGARVAAGGFRIHVWDVDAVKDEKVKELDVAHGRASPESTVRLVFDPRDKANDTVLAVNPSGALAVTRPVGPAGKAGAGEQLSPQGWVVGAGYQADGLLFTANVDGTVRYWDHPLPETGVATFALPRARNGAVVNGVLTVDYRADGKAVAAGTRDGRVFVYDPAGRDAPRELVCSGDGVDTKQVAEVEFTPDGKRLIAQDITFRVFVFDMPPPGGGPHRPLAPRNVFPWFVAASPDGKTVVCKTDHGNQFVVTELDTGRVQCTVEVPGGVGPPTDEADDGFLLRVRPVAFSPDKSRLAVADRAGLVRVFSTADGKLQYPPLEHVVDGDPDAVRQVAFSPDGTRLLTRSPRARGLWDAASGAKVNYVENRVGIQLSRFGPAGRLVLGGTNFSAAEVWGADGKPLLPGPLVHGGEVWGVAADPAEGRVLTASYDRTARVWDVATGRPVSPPLAHAHGVTDADFSPDGTRVLTGSLDGTLKLWPVPAPVPDNEPRVTAWVEVQTGLRVTPGGVGQLFDATEWAKRRADLTRLGGPPVPTRR